MKRVVEIIAASKGTSIFIPPTDFGITRKEMPQIHDDDDFLQYLEAQGVELEHTKVPVMTIKPTQSEFDLSKISNMVKDKVGDKDVGVYILSSDGYILDGHHRYIATLNHAPEKEVDAVVTNLLIQELLLKANAYSGTTSADIT